MHVELPYACSLCGSCTDVCPVRIPLHHQLLAWRGELARSGQTPRGRRWAFALLGWCFARPAVYRGLGRVGRALARRLPTPWLDAVLAPWTRQRALPPIPESSFRSLERARRRGAERARRREGA
jgi:L-lactate dehydrogenase complex protein LldF